MIGYKLCGYPSQKGMWCLYNTFLKFTQQYQQRWFQSCQVTWATSVLECWISLEDSHTASCSSQIVWISGCSCICLGDEVVCTSEKGAKDYTYHCVTLTTPQLHSFLWHVKLKDYLHFEAECSWEASPVCWFIFPVKAWLIRFVVCFILKHLPWRSSLVAWLW